MTATRAERRASRTGRGRRRAVVALGVIVALVAFAEWRRPEPSAPSSGTAWAATVDLAGEGANTWYCSAGTSDAGGRADETVWVMNAAGPGGGRARVRVSVMTGLGVAPVTTEFVLAPDDPSREQEPSDSQRAIRVADLAASSEPGVVVEARGAPVVVTHSVSGVSDIAAAPCARGSRAEWWFGGGTTVLGAQEWITLFNPYPGDAVVDLSFLTDQGVEAPGDVQGLVVPATSRVSVAVHDAVRRRAVVAAHVVTRRGRVVAEQLQLLDGRDGRRGIALVPGAPMPAREWWFAGGATAPGRSTLLTMANPAAEPVTVRIDTALQSAASLEPITVEIGPRDVAVVTVSERVPAATAFAWHVRASTAEGVVAHALTVQQGSSPSIAADAGSPVASTRWFIVPGSSRGEPAHSVSLLATGHRATVRTRSSETGGGAATSRTVLGPDATVRLDLEVLGAVTVEADAPIVVAREESGGFGAAWSTAVPVCPDPGGATGPAC